MGYKKRKTLRRLEPGILIWAFREGGHVKIWREEPEPENGFWEVGEWAHVDEYLFKMIFGELPEKGELTIVATR